MTTSDRQRAAAIESLSRIRVADRTEQDGSRVVWHQSAAGAEVVSWVDSSGFLERQELTLLGEQLVWARGAGLSTGTVSEEGGSVAGRGSALVTLDHAPSEERLERARVALLSYAGKDKYLVHLRAALGAPNSASAGSGAQGFVRTLSELPVVNVDGRRRWTAVLALGLGLAALAAVALLLLTGRAA